MVFHSALVPPYVRRSRSLDAAIPWLYLKGVAAGEMRVALTALVGSQAKGLSANVVGRLKRQWQSEHAAWSKRRLDRERWVYMWADGIYSGLRASSEKLCALVVIGVNERGEKRFLAIEDGVRESKQSWREVLLDLKARGMSQAPELAVGDGALGFWAALGRSVSEGERTALLGAQDGERPELPAEIGAGQGQASAARGVDGGNPPAGQPGAGSLRGCLPGEVSQGGELRAQRPPGAAGVLRLPGGALGTSAHHQPDRIHLCHDPPEE